MPDFSVTGIVTIDNTDALASTAAIMEATDKATREMVILRRKALSTLSLVNGMVRQGYGSLKQLVERAGGMIDPMFDFLFNMLASLVSTALSGYILLMSTLNPALIAIGLVLMVVAAELNLKAQLELAESKGLMQQIQSNMIKTVSPQMQPFGGHF